MPFQSEAQRRFFYAADHDPAVAKREGLSSKVIKDFIAADKPGPLPEHVSRAYGGDVIDTATRISRMPMAIGGGSLGGGQGDGNPYGFSLGSGGGRTDKNNVDVAGGSYVLPADVVSGLGEGNSLAGAAVVDKMMRTLPYGIKPISGGRRGPGPPNPPAPWRDTPTTSILARGGTADNEDDEEGAPVPIASADGEIILTPDQVMAIGNLYFPSEKPATAKALLDHGHQVLDEMVKHVRGRTISELEKLPGPKDSKNARQGHIKPT